jgi:protein TonB
MKPKKNPNINIEDIKSRSVYVLSGLVLVTAFILCLFEYKRIDLAGANIKSYLTALEDEEVMEIEPNTPKPPQPPPPPAPPEEVEVLQEDDKRDETKTIIIDQEADFDIVIELEEEPEPIVEKIFDVVEENPEFIGGITKLHEYLVKNIKYPEMAKNNDTQGKVFVQFVVWKDGTIKDVKVVKGVHKILDIEAARVVKTMPKWNPGKQRGKSVNARFILPIKFRLG